MINILKTSIELGLICSLTSLSLFLSYKMLGVCDLSTDGCFTLGATVGASIALLGHPYLSIITAILAGVLSGLVTSFLQTKMKIESLLAGIIVNTALYSINIWIMKGSSLLNLNKTDTVFTLAKTFSTNYKIVVSLLFVLLVLLFLNYFLKTRIGLSIRATGDNLKMAKSSSIDTDLMIIIGLSLSGGISALSGCLLGFYQKSVSIDMGDGMLTIALASLLIGYSLCNKKNISTNSIFVVLGSIIFRIIYMLALRLNMPAYMLKLVSAIIVIFAIYLPYLKKRSKHA